MTIQLVLFALLSVLAYCCPPPFEDFRYLDNATLLRDTIADITAKAKYDPQLGWAHVISDPSPHKPWPSNDDKMTFVPFCFADEFTKSKLNDIFAGAWRRWYNAIGNAGPGQGHRLGGFSEIVNEKRESVWCFTDSQNKVWNSAVRPDALVVNINQGGYKSSSLTGYRPNDCTTGRHQMNLGWFEGPDFDACGTNTTDEVATPTSDSNATNFEAAAKALADSSTTMTIDKLCRSSIFGRLPTYVDTGFRSCSYSTEDYWEMSHKDKNGNHDGQNHPYTVTSAPQIEKKGQGLKELPLVKWKDGEFGYVPQKEVADTNAEFLVYSSARLGPTSKDVGIVKALYGWGA
ncbi:hypothetical protein BKA63DRAFT_559387 [Paraphoma chrysanthemicola]|nr:hypothetical protein BKA63DRAFT_559387 [Paraphoma chrysanthemicola]